MGTYLSGAEIASTLEDAKRVRTMAVQFPVQYCVPRNCVKIKIDNGRHCQCSVALCRIALSKIHAPCKRQMQPGRSDGLLLKNEKRSPGIRNAQYDILTVLYRLQSRVAIPRQNRPGKDVWSRLPTMRGE